MIREEFLEKLKSNITWDVIIIGGGASGLGAAVESASRGYKTLLLEKNDFASGTSSKSTKLIHGGVRYLELGDFSLVREALKERGFLLKNAPHLVHPLVFIMPVKNWFKSLYYYLGIKIYDLLSGKYRINNSSYLSHEAVRNADLKDIFSYGIKYYDAQFDDARLALSLMQTFIDLGGVSINYMDVKAFIKNEQHKIIGVDVLDIENQKTYSIHTKVVLNATGVFVDTIRSMDDESFKSVVTFSQGSHIVLDKSFYHGNEAIILPKTKDGRVLFIIPWHKHVLIGTTETLLKDLNQPIRPQEQEIDFLLETTSTALLKKPLRKDVLSAFAGVRPLVNSDRLKENPSKISREHEILISDSNLVSLFGGKWTTYRLMGQNVIDVASKVGGLNNAKSVTENLKIHGYVADQAEEEWSYYGSDLKNVERLADDNKDLLIKYHPELPIRPVDVIWAVKKEMARQLEDVLARRSRCLFFNAAITKEIAPKVVVLMASLLSKDQTWIESQLSQFNTVVKGYTGSTEN